MNHSTPLTRYRWIDRRQLIYLALVFVAIFLLLPRIVRFGRVLALLQVAHPAYVLLALVAETLRYLASAATTRVLARLFDRDIPLLPMTQAFFAGAAANRTVSTGGAPGMLIRLMFLMRHGVSAGSVAAIFLIEDIAGLVIAVLSFVAGAVTLTAAQPSKSFLANGAIAFTISALLFALGGLYALRHRAVVERAAHFLACMLRAVTQRLMGRPVFTTERVQRALDDFYAGMIAARRAPSFVIAAFLLNLLCYVAGAAALYCAFLAFGWHIAPGILILLYTFASMLTTVSAAPGELALMGTGLALLSLAFGVSTDVALLALLLSRAIAFWLPIPVGYLAFWNLQRRRYL